MKVADEFWTLVQAAESAWQKTDGTDELEPYLLQILQFVQSNSNSREELVENFKTIVKEEKWPIEILEFCMRELKWDEIKLSVLQEMSNSSDLRVRDALSRVLAVYEKEWEDSDLYKYYS
ncbi:MAG: hypothetical protein OEZ58_09180 [Gammaproteobacteria bacterium]|nr:hypothetical protein [Gammaproteobacteria bacterium]MDH5729149.1 hypothetical protein [Gammaproteobacteria bacterium]